ncbi:MAG: hypothetical protein AB7L84_16830 [Acidimicrobiia bacterium]
MDLAPVVDLFPALWDEWAGLRFDGHGRLLNGMTGGVVEGLTLAEGRHRQPGARYRLTVVTPEVDLPDALRTELDEEASALSRRKASRDEWSAHTARRREASVQVGTRRHDLVTVLHEDTARKVAFTVSHEDQPWSVDVVVERRRVPRVTLDGCIDLTASLRAAGMPGCLSALFGGTGRGTAAVDLGSLERSARALEASGRANRFRAEVAADVRTSAARWAVKGRARLRARGLGRPVLWFTGRKLRSGLDRAFADLWASADAMSAELEEELHRLRAAIHAEGGPAAFVRRALWDDGFDDGLARWRADRPRR